MKIPTDPSDSGAGANPLLSVENLRVTFRRPDGTRYAVVEDVSFVVMPGEIIGIVGESGSGKSITARATLGLRPPGGTLSGAIHVQGDNVFDMTERQLRKLRGARVAMVFQDPMTSLNPVFTVGAQIGEAIQLHAKLPRKSLSQRITGLLSRVGIRNAEARARAYPHEFSGGMRQRALIAMGISNAPALLIADEPTTALDVTVQDQILQLLRNLNRQSGTSILLITHNIAVVASLCQRIIVMYAGRIVEDGAVETVLADPQHPYTWSLLRSVPRIDRAVDRLTAIAGQPPDPTNPVSGCAFHPRCEFAEKRCEIEPPPLMATESGHWARCWVLMRNVRKRI